MTSVTAPVRRGDGADAVRSAGRALAASALGAALVPACAFALAAAPLSMAPAETVAGWIARRLTWIDRQPRTTRPRAGRLLGLLGVEALLGLVSASVLGLMAGGLVVAAEVLVGAATGGPVGVFDADPEAVGWTTVAEYAVPGLVLLFLAASGLAEIGWLDRRAWARAVRPGVGELTRQVDRLSTTLADVVAAVDAERRRIERDIHDGVQQRVVALSILLARAERADDEERRRDLQRQARAETSHILDDLRDVAWRTYPAMLARDGLVVALEALRDRVVVPVRLHVDDLGATDRAAETAAYFVASEAVTNAIKHARAANIDIRVAREGDELVLLVRDDGVGGADPAGPGLTGIASRAAARGGVLRVDSPPGGPTTIEARIPCA